MNKVSTCILLLFLIAGCRTSQDITTVPATEKIAPVIDRELFFDDPQYAGAQISPDGNFISFRKQLDGVMNVWVKRVDGPFDAARPMTSYTTRSITDYFWSRDSRYILYVQDKGGDENFHIYAVSPTDRPAEGKRAPEPRNLTNIDGVRAQIYAVPIMDPDYIIIGLNERDPQLHDVYRLDLETGRKELLIENDQNISNWHSDEAGNIRNAVRQTPDGGTEILEINGDQLTPVYEVSAEETVNIVRYHEDFERFYLSTNKGDADLSRLILFDPETGEEELIAADPEREVDFGGAIFSDISNELLATYYMADRVRMVPQNEEFERDYNNIGDEVGDARINISSRTADENIWIVSAGKDTDPGSAYVYYRDSGKMELLYNSRPDLPPDHLAEMHAIRYTARDGMEIPAYLTLPRGMERQDLPVVINPHGGPWTRDYWGYDATAQFLANRGYAVLQPNFRGSTGYGKEFLNAGNKEWGTGAMQHDITDGVKYLIDLGIADPGRIGIYGGSYGGYAALAGLAFTPGLYAAGVSVDGPSNMITLLNSIPPYWEPIREMFRIRVGDLEDPGEGEMMKEQSPLFSADQIKAPLLVIQGANDPRSPKVESDQIVAALRKLGREVEYIVAPDEGHEFTGHENRLAYIADMERFLSEHLGGRYQESMTEDIRERLDEIKVNINTVTMPEEAVGIDEAKTAPLPAVSGDLLQSSTLEYVSHLETQGQNLEMKITRRLSQEIYEGQPVWRLIEHAKMPMGEITDTIDVQRDDLLPVRRSTQQGPLALDLQYSATTIDGEITQGDQVTPLNINLDAPVYADGSGLHLALSSLPLTENYKSTFRIYDVMTLEVKPMALEVSGIETITVPAGPFSAYKLEITPMDNDSGKQTVWITNDESRKVVRIKAILPEEMGGGSIVTELTE
ncbi:MAG: alpha/beta fold hydrolase [Balneolales bacterium]